jgi:hypothetical protein
MALGNQRVALSGDNLTRNPVVGLHAINRSLTSMSWRGSPLVVPQLCRDFPCWRRHGPPHAPWRDEFHRVVAWPAVAQGSESFLDTNAIECRRALCLICLAEVGTSLISCAWLTRALKDSFRPKIGRHRSDRGPSLWPTPPRSLSRTSPSRPRMHRLPRGRAAASANRRSGRHGYRST